MSIQFDCDGCGQSLKVPPGSSGKKVRCPQCEAVNIIPPSSEPDVAATNPFAPTEDAFPRSTQQENPFAAPTSAPDVTTPSTGELTYNKVEFGDVCEQTWRRFKPQIWISALFGLIFMGIAVLSGIIGLANQAAQASGEVAIIVPVFIIVFVIQQCIQGYQQCMGKRYGLNVARGSSEVLNGVFNFDKVVRVLLFFLLVAAVSAAVVGFVALPAVIGLAISQEGAPAMIGVGITALLGFIAVVVGIVCMFRIFISIYFMIDRDAGILDAMKQSNMFMTGNSLIVWLLMFVVGIGVMLFAVITCGVGLFFAYPFLEVLQSVVYLKVTGQYQNVETHEATSV